MESFNCEKDARDFLGSEDGKDFREPSWFCPLINKKCVPECVCCVEAIVIPEQHRYTSTKYYWIRAVHCSNAMFFREG